MRNLTEVFGGRSRWMAIGAIGAVVLGAGGLITASAAPSTSPSTLIPMTPCRLMDTRSDRVVGTRNTPIGANETYTATVWGTNGNCTIPASATSVVINVVASNGTAGSFLTAFPADVDIPNSSMLNWTAGQAPVTNGATAALSADGKLKFNNFAGNVDLLVDITGYYAPVTSTPAISGGVEFSENSAAVTLTPINTPLVVGSIAITAPAAGVVIVNASTSILAADSATTRCELMTGASTIAGPFNSAAGLHYRRYATSTGLTVAAGTTTVNLVCTWTGNGTAPDAFDTDMTAIYSPNRV